MAHLYRLIVALVFAVIGALLAPTVAHASFAATVITDPAKCYVAPCTGYKLSGFSPERPVFGSIAAVCADYAAAYMVNFPSEVVVVKTVDTSTPKCILHNNTFNTDMNGNVSVLSIAPATPTYSCPGGATLAGTTCTCSSSYTQVGNTCVSTAAVQATECKAVADSLNIIGAPMVHYGAVGLTACYGGYVIAGSGGAAGGGQSELYGPYKCSGTSASACSAVPKPSSIVVECPQGQYPGTVNGVQVCSPPENSVEAPKTTTATPPTPGASAPEIPGAPPGTTSQSEQTICTGTSCTKTTTYKDAAGNSKGSKTEEIPKANYCADNPKAPGCEEEKSSFSGSCSGGFVGVGDALQVAIAREQHVRNCQFYENPTEQAKFDAEAGKTGKQYASEEVAISSGSFSQMNLLGVGAQCVTDKTITVMTATVVLPFSRVCPSLDQLGIILLGVSFITALMIVAKGKN